VPAQFIPQTSLRQGARSAGETSSSFNPKPEAMAGAMRGRPIPLPAIASGFGLNDPSEIAKLFPWRSFAGKKRGRRGQPLVPDAQTAEYLRS